MRGRERTEGTYELLHFDIFVAVFSDALFVVVVFFFFVSECPCGSSSGERLILIFVLLIRAQFFLLFSCELEYAF